ncbi:hypothetical protein Tco_0339189 [Tanacetum coccineum]
MGDKGRKKGGVFKRLGDKGRNVSAHSESHYQSSKSRRIELTPKRRYHEGTTSRKTKPLSESEDNGGGHWMSRSKRKKSSIKEDDLSQPWVCEETDSFTPRIHYFDFPKKTRMPSNAKTYNGSDDPEGGTLGNANMVPHEAGRKQNFDRKGDFRNQQRSERGLDKFTLLTKSLKKILALDKGKFKTSPPMTTPVEKRNNNRFCKFHGEVGHNTDECMHLKRQIEELVKAGKMSHVIKELKKKVARQRITQSFSLDPEISFPPLEEEVGTEALMIIEVEIGGHFIHRMYVDGGSTSEIL